MENVELFNALIIINIAILLKYVVKGKSMACAQYSVIIIKTTAFKTNL